MKKILVIFFMLTTILGCNSKNQKTSNNQLIDSLKLSYETKLNNKNSQIDSLIHAVKAREKTIDSLISLVRLLITDDTLSHKDTIAEEIEYLNHIFYHEVIRGRDTPVAQKVNGYAKLMISSFIGRLKRLEIFDSTFIESQKKEFQPCAEAIDEMKYSGTLDLGWEPRGCGFFNYYYYIGGQESPTYFETKDILTNGEIATAKIEYYDVFDRKRYTRNLHLDITYINKEGKWLIHEVSKVD